jgi:hypothetical protein
MPPSTNGKIKCGSPTSSIASGKRLNNAEVSNVPVAKVIRMEIKDF